MLKILSRVFAVAAARAHYFTARDFCHRFSHYLCARSFLSSNSPGARTKSSSRRRRSAGGGRNIEVAQNKYVERSVSHGAPPLAEQQRLWDIRGRNSAATRCISANENAFCAIFTRPALREKHGPFVRDNPDVVHLRPRKNVSEAIFAFVASCCS